MRRRSRRPRRRRHPFTGLGSGDAPMVAVCLRRSRSWVAGTSRPRTGPRTGCPLRSSSRSPLRLRHGWKARPQAPLAGAASPRQGRRQGGEARAPHRADQHQVRRPHDLQGQRQPRLLRGGAGPERSGGEVALPLYGSAVLEQHELSQASGPAASGLLLWRRPGRPRPPPAYPPPARRSGTHNLCCPSGSPFSPAWMPSLSIRAERPPGWVRSRPPMPPPGATVPVRWSR